MGLCCKTGAEFGAYYELWRSTRVIIIGNVLRKAVQISKFDNVITSQNP